ncbi:RluA family pseudouridine synthase [Kushneria marisflavi]|uniref:Pseudouridine synthase n=1 Tax=Kushneria marisflavi TaxID=157779 RepID=A0A240ULC6_9GAMM|nr:RluA family pseudouridine synthase [Kushneria marisflavi]ART61820.1 23S rRNA pseudouridine(955/2504/2580) synthase [Kushneria marisflavi]RKD86853.1 ribosomal large subunit pseudouridine synthase C [Kushneria marisflavi]
MAEGRGVQWLDIDEHHDGQRLDNFLLAHLKGAPRTLIYRIIRRGEVRINGGRGKASRRLVKGDRVRVPPLRLTPQEAVQDVSDNLRHVIERSVLKETPDWMVFNKPSGLAVHGGSGVKIGLIEALRQIRDDLPYLELVHRLDRDTSGCLLVAKSREALNFLSDELRAHRMQKHYLALVEGRWSVEQREVSAPLLRFELPNGERRVRVEETGKPSKTRFKLIESLRGATLIEAEPVTGRTHQIRIHAVHAGHPLLGDTKYGSVTGERLAKRCELSRLFLHARTLGFTDPASRQPVTLHAPLSDDLLSVLARLR